MARKPIQIGNVEFKFQKDALAYFKEMLSSCRNNQNIDTSSENHSMLLALIERHPEADQKIGVGIKHFFKAPTDMGTSCFWLEREDGTKTDFSYPTAVKAKGKSLYQEFSEACRHSIKNDLIKTKENFFDAHADGEGKVECEITGDRISIYESHLDHTKPLTFQVIVNTFITANKICISSDILSTSVDGQFTTEFINKDIENKFKEYHHSIAQLRIINPKSNLSLGGTERIKKRKRPVIISI